MRCSLWMQSWQSRDSIPCGCGWLWILPGAYPPVPPAIHERIHAARGYYAHCPHSSTTSQQYSPTMWKMGCVPARMTPHVIPTSYPQNAWLLHTVIHRMWSDGEGCLEDRVGAYLCTQGMSCPHFQACYPRIQRGIALAGQVLTKQQYPEKCRLGRSCPSIHIDCG